MVDLSSIHGELVRGTSCHWLIVSFGRVMFLFSFVHCQKKASNDFFCRKGYRTGVAPTIVITSHSMKL